MHVFNSLPADAGSLMTHILRMFYKTRTGVIETNIKRVFNYIEMSTIFIFKNIIYVYIFKNIIYVYKIIKSITKFNSAICINEIILRVKIDLF